MFGLFRKKTSAVKITDKVWMTEPAKFSFLADEYKKDQQLLIVCWFDDTYRKLGQFFPPDTSSLPLVTAREVRHSPFKRRRIFFAEHYPLEEKEKELYEQLKLGEIVVCSSLDEPLFTYFGGERIAELMKRLGMEDKESVEHIMISRSIINAQQKIAKKMLIERSASSQSSWFEKNLTR